MRGEACQERIEQAPAVDAAVPFTRLQLDERSWVDVARHFLRGADTLFEELRDLVEEAWLTRAQKRLAKAWLAERGETES